MKPKSFQVFNDFELFLAVTNCPPPQQNSILQITSVIFPQSSIKMYEVIKNKEIRVKILVDFKFKVSYLHTLYVVTKN